MKKSPDHQPIKSATPIPKVTGPIPVTKTSRPFTVGGTDLEKHGYRLDEYFISGQANVYDWGRDGNASIPQIRTANAPYTTRILVRRPKNPDKFSGNVWVEMNNTTRGWDVEIQWPTIQDKVLRDSDIWVSVTVKPISIAALQRVDSERYAPLSMDNPLPYNQQPYGKLPDEEGYDENLSKLYENGLIWDILSQTGGLVRSKNENNPLHTYDVKFVFATGESQSGIFLNTYAADFAEYAKLENGQNVYDGFISASGSGRTTPINQCLPPAFIDDRPFKLPKKHVPFMQIDAQGDIFQLASYKHRQPDSDDPEAGFRLYEITGAPHGPINTVNYQPSEEDVIKSGNLPANVPYAYGGMEPKANQLPRHYVEIAMYKNMERWVIEGVLPPRAEPLKVKESSEIHTSYFGETVNASFEKDKYGNVLSGVRSPYVDVPIATYNESATLKEGYVYAWSFGHQVDFTSEQLQKLYGKVGTHQNYVKNVEDSVKQLLEERWLETEEGRKIIQQAIYTPIP